MLNASTSTTTDSRNIATDLLIIGAGPAGSAAAFHAARAGMDVLVVDMAQPGRDKTCGDGLTPRAASALQELGSAGSALLADGPTIRGLKLHGFGGSITAPWPTDGAYIPRGSAVARADLDARLLQLAINAGARFIGGLKITHAHHSANRVTSVSGVYVDGAQAGDPNSSVTISCTQLLLAEGVRSAIARSLGVQWLKGMVHGVAARSYIETPAGNDQWIHSHLELRSADGMAQPGYGWMFPLGQPHTLPGSAGAHTNSATNSAHNSHVQGTTTPSQPQGTTTPSQKAMANLGCGALSTTTRPAKVNTKKLLVDYAESVRELWSIEGQPLEVKSALLPMGGAVTRVSGHNWAAIGDTAALVNPLNGEGIDYALESARHVVRLLPDARRNPDGLTYMWPALLRREYGDAFSLARRLAMVLTMPGLLAAIGPLGMRGPLAHTVMGSAARLMGNLVTPEDRDITARLWLGAGRLSRGVDALLAEDSRPLFGWRLQ